MQREACVKNACWPAQIQPGEVEQDLPWLQILQVLASFFHSCKDRVAGIRAPERYMKDSHREERKARRE